MSKEFNIANAELLALVTKDGATQDEVQTKFEQCNKMRKQLADYGDNRKYLAEMETMYISIQGAIRERFTG